MINCLCLSKHACPQDQTAATYLLSHPQDYQYRLAAVLKTLPDKSSMRQWRRFEFGDLQLFGSDHLVRVGSRIQNFVLNDVTKNLCLSESKFFICDHSMCPVDLLNIWPKATHIKLINGEKFQSVALTLKYDNIFDRSLLNGNYCREKFDLLKGDDWPEWEVFMQSGYDVSKLDHIDTIVRREIEQFYPLTLATNPVLLFDVDQCYFDQNMFLTSMHKLYDDLGFDDFQPDLVGFFYQKYISLHTQSKENHGQTV